MARPVVPTVQNVQDTIAGAATTQNIQYPQGIEAGDGLLFIHCANGAGRLTATPTGWTELQAPGTSAFGVSYSCYYKDAAGTESGTFSVTQNASTQTCSRVYRFSNVDFGTNPPELTLATGDSTTPTPGTITHSGGSDDYLYLVACGVDAENIVRSVTAVPTGYEFAALIEGNISLRVGSKFEAASTSDTPGTFTIDGVDEWFTFSIAIPGVGTAAPQYVPVDAPWTSQPPSGTHLDTSNSLSEGIVYAINYAQIPPFSGSEDLNTRLAVSGNGRFSGFDITQLGFRGSSTWDRATNKGLSGLRTDGTADVRTVYTTSGLNGFDPDGYDWTIALLVEFDSLSSDQGLAGLNSTSGGGFQIWADQVGSKLRLAIFDGAATYGSNDRFSVNTPYLIVVTYNSTSNTCTAYVDGVQELQDTGFAPTASPTDLQILGSQSTIGKGFGGAIYFSAIYDRVLSPAEVRSLSANPWQVFEPRAIYYPIDAGAAPPASTFKGLTLLGVG